jgi:hypothetical protein
VRANRRLEEYGLWSPGSELGRENPLDGDASVQVLCGGLGRVVSLCKFVVVSGDLARLGRGWTGIEITGTKA